MTWRDSLAPLAGRRFRFYFASRAVNLAGTTMAPIALAFAVLAVENSPTALGQVLAARSIPTVVFLLVGGVLADRLGRRRVLQVANAVSAVSQGVAAALVITGQAELWHLVLIEAVNGTASAASFPAMQGMVPQLVSRTLLQQANALLGLVRSGLLVLGPTVAALLVVGVGPGWALAVDALAWLLALLLMVPVRVPHAAPPPGTGVLADLREGWTYVRRTEWLWVVVLAFAALNAILAGGWYTLGPVVARDTVGVAGWGYAVSAEAVGLLVAGLVLLRVPLRRPLRAGMIGITALAPPLVLLGLEPRLLPLLVAAFVGGVGLEVFSIGWSVAMQEHVPSRMLSRASSYDALGSFAAIPLGQLAAGPLAGWWGTDRVLVAGGVAFLSICLLSLVSPQVRSLGRIDVPTGPPAAPG